MKNQSNRILALVPTLVVIGVYALLSSLSACDTGSEPSGGGNANDTTVAFDISKYNSAEDCRSCHPDQVEQWEGSMHAYAAKDPLFTALNLAGQMAYVNAVDQECIKCHAVFSSKAGETPWGEFDVTTISPQGAEGITCDVCHMVESIGSFENNDFHYSTGTARKGTIVDPVPNAFHESEYQSMLTRSEFCGACHDLRNHHGVEVEATYLEWRDAGYASTGKTCMDCHMKEYTGRATPDSPIRTLHDHSMPGGDLAHIPGFPGKEEQLLLVTERLQNALSLELSANQLATANQAYDFTVSITNDSAGHNIPTGASFLREVWLAVTVIDGAGDTVYSSGMFDAKDDLMDDDSEFPARDTDLFNLQSTMMRADSSKTWAPWDIEILVNPSLRPMETRDINYSFTVPAGAVSPLSIDVAMRYRAFPPHILRAFSLDWMLPLPIINMAQDSALVLVQ